MVTVSNKLQAAGPMPRFYPEWNRKPAAAVLAAEMKINRGRRLFLISFPINVLSKLPSRKNRRNQQQPPGGKTNCSADRITKKDTCHQS
jgi:hypothetical protein